MALTNQALTVGVNTYVALADAQTYTTNVGSGATISEGDLRRGFAYIESYRDQFQGTKTRRTDSATMQPVSPEEYINDPQWPRTGVCVDGITVPSDVVPRLICDAQTEAAIQFAGGNDPLQTSDTQVLVRERYGDVEFQYADRSGTPPPQAVVFRRVEDILAPVLKYSGGEYVVTR